MEQGINLDTGLTPLEEEALLIGPEEVDLSSEEDADAILKETDKIWTGIHTKDAIGIEEFTVPDDLQFGNPLQLNDSGKEEMPKRTKVKCPPLQRASPTHVDSMGLGSLENLRGSRLRQQKRSGREPEREGPGALKTARAMKTKPRDTRNCTSKSKGTKRLEKRVKEQTQPLQEKNLAVHQSHTRPKKSKPVSQTKSPEVIEIEDGEIPAIDDASLARKVAPQKTDMGKKMSLPQVLRTFADALEEGEIAETGPGATESSRDQNKESPAKTWKKNGGKRCQEPDGIKTFRTRQCRRRAK